LASETNSGNKSNNEVSIELLKTTFHKNSTNIDDEAIQKEAYAINILQNKITIQYADYPGLIHALMSFTQIKSSKTLLGKHRYKCTVINDYPRFQYRGMHLDVCRHFFPASFIKKYIKMLAFYKYNTFHWHLTEDQGWRIEIKKYPKLTQVGAFRNGSQTGPWEAQTFDTGNYGGFYTQVEVKEIVAYAKSFGITVIPEIEMPGHSLAALSAYPQFSCNGGTLLSSLRANAAKQGKTYSVDATRVFLNRKGDSVINYNVAPGWGVFDDVYCAGNENTFQFIQDVLDEVIALFPEAPYIHIGGDECPKTRWKTCDLCQTRIKTLGLKDEHELQSYFIQRIEKYINSKGKRIIGWDEILEGGLAPNAIVMSWRGNAGGIAAANQNHNAIMTPGRPCYFDHYQGTQKTEPNAIGGFNPLDTTYYYNPIPADLDASKHNYILGSQANVWTEYMPNEKQVEFMTLPRASALAEVLWSPQFNFTAPPISQKENGDQKFIIYQGIRYGQFLDYLNRVQSHERLWKKWNWNYRPVEYKK
jgi:hexosaminidase